MQLIQQHFVQSERCGKLLSSSQGPGAKLMMTKAQRGLVCLENRDVSKAITVQKGVTITIRDSICRTWAHPTAQTITNGMTKRVD